MILHSIWPIYSSVLRFNCVCVFISNIKIFCMLNVHSFGIEYSMRIKHRSKHSNGQMLCQQNIDSIQCVIFGRFELFHAICHWFWMMRHIQQVGDEWKKKNNSYRYFVLDLHIHSFWDHRIYFTYTIDKIHWININWKMWP